MSNLFRIILVIFPVTLQAQSWQKAYLDEDGLMRTEQVQAAFVTSKNTDVQMTGFPASVTGNATFKNMRSLALADINGDGADDIVFGADNKLYVWTYQGKLWEKPLTGTAIYPPSVADLNNDGFPEIVQLTGGVPANGRVYVVDKDGNDMPGWPLNFSSHWMMCSAALADMDGDDTLEIIVGERNTTTNGKIHVLRINGTSFSSNWPVSVDGTPAVTPSVGDVDNDGEPDVVAYSTQSRYIFGLDGLPKSGFPMTTEPGQKYSYQSPVIADFGNDGFCETVGATHGDLPQYYIMTHQGAHASGWPLTVADSGWTYSTPTVVKINGEWKIFMSRPIGSEADEMLYGWDENASLLPGFPLVKPGGLEGYISVADINNDNEFELVFGSNMLDSAGNGFIHAYRISDGTPLPGFPLSPRGWTFMNGVCIGDVNGDGQMDFAALSYTNSFGAETDSVYINVYEMNVPATGKILWGTYKGSNDRCGYIPALNAEIVMNSLPEPSVYPNPAQGVFHVSLPEKGTIQAHLYSVSGSLLYSCMLNENEAILNLTFLPAGCYMLKLSGADQCYNELIMISK